MNQKTTPIQKRDYNKLAIHVARSYKQLKTSIELKQMPILVDDAACSYRLPHPTAYQSSKILSIAVKVLQNE